MLRFLAARGGSANRSAIGAALGLAQANLTRVLNLMVEAGLLERTIFGKEAVFALSRTGTAAARSPADRPDRRSESREAAEA